MKIPVIQVVNWNLWFVGYWHGPIAGEIAAAGR